MRGKEMDKNVENYINRTKTALTSGSIIAFFFVFMLCIIVGGAFSLHLGEFILLGLLAAGVTAILGFYFTSIKCEWGMSFYMGVTMIEISIASFTVSYVCLNILTGLGPWLLIFYLPVFVCGCAGFILFVWKKIKNDAYSKKPEKTNVVSAYIGAGLTVAFCPVIFSNPRLAVTFLAVVFLFTGIIFTAGSSCFFKAFLQKKYL